MDNFDADFNADEWHATLVFYRDDEDRIFLTYLSHSWVKQHDEYDGSGS